ncbi:Arsenate reductase, glutaredoxin family [Paracoccus isoporae]|uniref:Arsenate reductase, glutaredoxin family n=1 Tax=Paracoccus isoporae TaxID=591205 RepID=A0A1G6XBM7_9RHOB|nr:ArsC/Spx/MgsR family protein [Paracoccus isoporae]SDD75568.1 Arsenate reductase, glutaredoxin family [Paracoccus isoporae]
MAKSLKMFGLDYCSTVQKARAALEAAGWEIEFHDVKQHTPDTAQWSRMLDTFGEKLVNRASLTWRGMSEDERSQPPEEMLSAKPALMKRPAIIAGEDHYLGWTKNVKRGLGIEE